jgi:predicted O-methyltransferase YrrM
LIKLDADEKYLYNFLGTKKEAFEKAMEEASVIVDYVDTKIGGKDYWQVSYDELQIIYACVKLKLPKLVVETGVGPGTTTTAILSAMRGTDGVLLSFDLGVKYGEEEEALPVGWVIPENLRSGWKLVIGDSRKTLENSLRSYGKINIFFHDSQHEYDHVMFELETARKYAESKPIFIVDNYDWTKAPADFARDHNYKLVNAADDLCLIFP